MDEIMNNSKLWREEVKNDRKPGTEEIPKDKNIEHLNQKIEENGVKNQLIKKTTERGIIRPNKLKNTREELDMVRSGLVNIDNLSIINHREEMNVKNYRRNLMKMFERNIPEIEIYYKISVRSLIMDVSMTSWFNKPYNRMFEIRLETSQRITEKK